MQTDDTERRYTEEELCAEYEAFLKERPHLPGGDAIELLFSDAPTAEDRIWLEDFSRRWERDVDGVTFFE